MCSVVRGVARKGYRSTTNYRRPQLAAVRSEWSSVSVSWMSGTDGGEQCFGVLASRTCKTLWLSRYRSKSWMLRCALRPAAQVRSVLRSLLTIQRPHIQRQNAYSSHATYSALLCCGLTPWLHGFRCQCPSPATNAAVMIEADRKAKGAATADSVESYSATVCRNSAV